MKKYVVKEIFSTLQGEGVWAGASALFVRFAHCNLQCTVATHGFDCDTDFASGEEYTFDELIAKIRSEHFHEKLIVFTGGEPLLQMDHHFALALKGLARLHIETNGTKRLGHLAHLLDWVTVSPKVPEQQLRVEYADELKYVVGAGVLPPSAPVIFAKHHFVSPAADGDEIRREAMDWAVQFCLNNPRWRLSMQQHKLWGVR